MSIATKLTYLNTTKGKIKDSINLTGANIGSNDTFRSYAVKLRDGLVQVLNDNGETLYNNFPKVSGTGSSISLSNTLEAPMFMNKFDGDTYQQTYTGKNLFDINNITNVGTGRKTTKIDDNTYKYEVITANEWWNNTNYSINVEPSTSYTYSVNVSELSIGSGHNTRIVYDFYDSNNNQIVVSNNYIDISTTGIYNKTFTTTSATVKVVIRIYVETSSPAVGSYVVLNNFMLEKGSTATSYEPYVGGQASPNPDYPQDIQSVEGIQNVNITGKNLWNNTQVVDTSDYIENNGTGFKLSKTTNGRITPKYSISIPANTSVIITNVLKNYTTSNGVIYCQWIATDDSTIWSPNINNTSITTSFNKDIKGIKFYLQTTENDNTYVEIENLMIRLASITDSTYVPYKAPQNYEVNLEGKNLFDKNNITSGKTFNTSGKIIDLTSSFIQEKYIPVSSSTQYTISTTNSYVSTPDYRLTICEYDENKNFIQRILEWQSTYKTITTAANTKYVRLCASNVTIDELQFERGTKTSYAPYMTPIKLYNGDKIVGTPYNWSIERKMGKTIFNGSEYWQQASNNYQFYITLSRLSQEQHVDIKPNSSLVTNYFKNSSTWEENSIFTATSAIGVWNKLTATADDFKNWLSTHNTEVIYELATPTTEQITDEYLISQLNALYNAKSYNGQTNISVSGNLPMILDVSALKGE